MDQKLYNGFYTQGFIGELEKRASMFDAAKGIVPKATGSFRDAMLHANKLRKAKRFASPNHPMNQFRNELKVTRVMKNLPSGYKPPSGPNEISIAD